MKRNYFLGVDGGGTKTTVAVMNSNGEIVSKTIGDGSNYRALGEHVAERNLRKAVIKAAKNFKGKIKYACFGMASVDTKKDKENVYRFIERCGLKKFLGCPILVVNDVEIILPTVTDERRGIAVIGGTGNNFYGINGGKIAKVAGVDYILSDEGSSYDIGLKVLRAAVRASDGRNGKTLLRRMVFKFAKVKDVRSLKDAVHEGLKVEIARFAVLATEAAKKGDKIAELILKNAAVEYVDGIKAVMNKTKLKGEFDIAFTGSLFTKKVLFDEVRKKVKKIAPKARFHIVEDSVVGAARLAMKQTGDAIQ